MRITVVMGFFLPMPPTEGGATEKSWALLAHEFARRGHEVTIVSRRWKNAAPDEMIDGVRYLRFEGYDHTDRLRRNLWREARWSLRVWRQLPPADVTVVNCVALPILLGMARRRAGRVAVMTGRMPKGQYRWYGRVDRVLAVSSAVRDAVIVESPALASRITITGYPIDGGPLMSPAPERPTDVPLTIGYVGRIHREKGLMLLARACALLAAEAGLPPWRLLLCGPTDIARGGSGPEHLAELRTELDGAGPRLHWELRPPVFNSTELAAIYRSIDLFCYPSLAAKGETFGVAVAEAMAAGAVPIVSALPCFTDFVEPGANGATFDHTAADAASQLARVLAALLRDPARRQILARAARSTVARYDVGPYADRLLADFSTLK